MKTKLSFNQHNNKDICFSSFLKLNNSLYDHAPILFKFLVLHLFPEESLTDVPILLLLVKSFLTRVVYDHEFDHFNISPSEFLTSSFRPRSCSRARLLHLRASTRVPRYETKINNSSTESRFFSRKKLSRPINSANVLRPRELFYRLKLNSFPPLSIPLYIVSSRMDFS